MGTEKLASSNFPRKLSPRKFPPVKFSLEYYSTGILLPGKSPLKTLIEAFPPPYKPSQIISKKLRTLKIVF